MSEAVHPGLCRKKSHLVGSTGSLWRLGVASCGHSEDLNPHPRQTQLDKPQERTQGRLGGTDQTSDLQNFKNKNKNKLICYTAKENGRIVSVGFLHAGLLLPTLNPKLSF